MTTFIRRSGGVPVADLGTRPGSHGQTLVSTGLADLDRLFGGGIPLGSLTLILEDGWTEHHKTLLKYFLSEGAACGQSIMLNAAHAYEENKKSDDSIMNPIQQSLGSFLVKQIDPNEPQKTPRPQQDITPNTTTHALQEASTSKDGPSIDSTEKKNKEEQVELRIAWQYGKYLKNESLNGSGQQHGKRSSSSGKEWCHTFDLTKQGGKECLVKCAHAVSLVHSTESSLTEHHETETARAAEYVTENRFGCPLSSLVASIAQFIDKTRPLKSGAAAAHQTVALKPGNIGRIAVMSLGSFDWRDIAVYDTSNAMPVIQTLLKIKGLVREQRCLAIVSLPVSLFSDSDALRMQHVADSVLSFRAVQNDADIVKLAPDPSTVVGIVHLKKLPSLGAIAAPSPQTSMYLVRSKHKRLTITQIETDPDAALVDGSAVGVGCSGPSGDKKTFDF